VVSRKDLGSWLEGPPPSKEQQWPGQRLGLPQRGPGSIARLGRRVIALMIDWILCYLIAAWLFGGNELSILLIFAVEQLFLVSTLGYSIGHRAVGIQVRKLDGSAAGPLAAVVRTVLLCLVVPAVVFDADQRGLHDRAMGTVLVRM
jgi:uncharacterized RDD family membrane protein YckC